MATAVTTEHAFQKCVELLRKLHDLIGAGQDESDEAETLRAQMDPLWHSMSEAERERIRGLSEDFYLMREGAPRQVQMLPDEKAHWSEEAATVLTRMLTGMEADAALKFLRKPMPADQPRYVVPFMKARCWERLGEMELALLFLEEAVRLDSHQAVCVLILLLKHGRREEAAKYAERIIDDKQSTGEELYQAAVALFLHTRRINPSQARPIWSKVVSVLERALRVFLTTPRHEREVPFADVFIFAMLGFVHRLLGSRETALRVYDEGLARYPTNATLLTLRGLALTDTDPAKALSDFRAAVQAQGRSMWPYFFLARDALQRKNYHDAWGLSLHAIELGERLGRPSEDEVPSGALAQLYEWLAISMAELGQPKDRVLDNFRKAQSLDPNNQRIQKNHAIAEGRWVAPEFKPGDQWKIDGASTKIVLPVEFPEESEAPDLFVKRADAGLLALASHR